MHVHTHAAVGQPQRRLARVLTPLGQQKEALDFSCTGGISSGALLFSDHRKIYPKGPHALCPRLRAGVAEGRLGWDAGGGDVAHGVPQSSSSGAARSGRLLVNMARLS